MVVVLMDHRVREGDLQVPFLGRPAYTTGFPAIVALKGEVPIHFMRCFREGNNVRVQFTPAMDFSDLPHGKEGILPATKKMNAVWENWIKEKPEPWLWIHNRWKN
jgi:Kdo2-lipid IVA lauroyltransferase/acyltransferase